MSRLFTGLRLPTCGRRTSVFPSFRPLLELLEHRGVPTETTTWTGNVSKTWNNALNWSNGIPTSELDVVITKKENNCILGWGNAGLAHKVTIETDAKFSIVGNSLTTSDVLTNNGEMFMTHNGLRQAILDTGNKAVTNFGTLKLYDGAITTSSLANNGTFITFGNHSVTGDFTNNGTLDIHKNPFNGQGSTFTVQGNYLQTGAGTLKVTIGQSNCKLAVTQNCTLGGTYQPVPDQLGFRSIYGHYLQ